MEQSLKPTVIFLGNTGSGKSAVCNYFRQKLAGSQDIQSPFEENDGANSTIMINPVAESYQQIQIVDTPGMSDSKGKENDILNLTKISEFSQELQVVNTFTFVLNEENPRFDESTQATFCLFYTQFEDYFLKHVNFIFTRAHKIKIGKVQTQKKMKEYTQILSERLQIPIENFPQFECFQFECHPDDYEGYNDVYKNKLVQRTEDEFQSFLQAVTQTEPLDSTNVVVSPEVILNAQRDADSQRQAIEHQMKIQEELNIKVSELQQQLQKQKEEQTLSKEEQKNSMLESRKKQEKSEERIENLKHEIVSLKRQNEKAKEQVEIENEKVSKWWWLLALPVPVGAGIAAGTATISAALIEAPLIASAAAAITTTTTYGSIYASVLSSIGFTSLGTTTTTVVAAVNAYAVPMATIGSGVSLGVGVTVVSLGLIVGGIKYLSMKVQKAPKK